MSAWDYEFIEGWDKYGPNRVLANTLAPFAGEWNSWASAITTWQLVNSLLGPGQALQYFSGAQFPGPSKTLPGNYARMKGTLYFNTGLTGTLAFQGQDGISPQFSVTVESTGKLGARTGAASGTLLGTSTASLTANTTHVLAWDVTVHNTAGIVKLWLDGSPVLTLTNVNTRGGTSNNYINAITLACAVPTTFDHLGTWYYLASGGTDAPPLTNPVVETQFPNGDSAVQFTPTQGILGQDYSNTATTNAPGANELFLRPFTPVVNCTLNSVTILPAATSATAKFKAVVYADSTGAPGSLLSSGNEVVGCSALVLLTGTLVTPQALTAGTKYWIGFITDTSVALGQIDASTNDGQKKANTYASGAPNPAGGSFTTGQGSWVLFGLCTSMAANWPQVSNDFGHSAFSASGYAFNSDSTVGHEDLFTFPALSTGSQDIYTVAVKTFCALSTAGSRTMTAQTKSSSTDTSGPAFVVAASYGWGTGHFDVDPNTAAAWTAPGLNAASSGYKIAS